MDAGNATERLRSSATRRVKVIGRNDIPATGVAAVAVNLTVDEPTNDGYATLWPDGQTQPCSSLINFESRQTVASSAITKVSPDGYIDLAKLQRLRPDHHRHHRLVRRGFDIAAVVQLGSQRPLRPQCVADDCRTRQVLSARVGAPW